MYTVIGWSESIDAGGVLSNLAAVPDTHARTSGDGITINEYNRLFGAYACVGASATLARIVSPSLRRVNPYQIQPIELALTPAGRPVHAIFPNISIPLDDGEDLMVEENGNPAAAEQCSIAVFLSSGPIQPVSGKIFSLRFTITLALVAGAWAFSEITWIDEPPVGEYTIVGGQFVIAAGVVARFVPKGGGNRPGCPVVAAHNFGIDPIFRNGGLGTWMSFKTATPPGVDVLSSAAAASATYECIMDVIAR